MNEEINVSVVIAAYNEAAVIEQNLYRVIAEMETRPEVRWEILCVNDGSADNTGELIDKVSQQDGRVHVFHHRRNFGQGKALRTGFDMCRGEVVVTLDADLSYSPEYIYQLIDALEKNKAEIALASAYHPEGSVANVPFYRLFLSRTGNYYLARMFNLHVSTITCVVRAYRRDILDSLMLNMNGMEMQLESLMKASMLGYRVCEIPARLAWAEDKAKDASIQRVSKMRIMKTIEMYLKLGWMQRPTYIFVFISALLLLPGIYTAILVAITFFRFFFQSFAANSLMVALSFALKELAATYAPTVLFSVVFLLFGFQTLTFSLIFLQNKLNFEEVYRLIGNGLNKEN